ncbi:hypothetical protein L218DRAFT_1073187 [Marasmius fiardii PR-910]|nr:hypothetical protein L218DRAFT_1073187 [Marasmius fiardii PR-910]
MSSQTLPHPSSQSSTNVLSGVQNLQNPTINRAVFNNISGGDQFNYSTFAHPAKTLWDTIAGVGATYDSGLQFARGSCLHGTRQAVLQDIHKWITSEGASPPVCWLSGPAGVGKSAIALTVASSCAKDNELAASFFFFRSDLKRNNPDFLMLTIAHGLCTTIPPLRRVIDQKIEDNPNLLEATLERQFEELIVRPLLSVAHKQQRWWRRVQKRLLPWSIHTNPKLVVVDGLDECSDNDTQQRIISILTSAYRQSPHFPLRLLICSRPEAWIRESFSLPNIYPLSKQIILDESYLPHKDIEWYLRHEFTSICINTRYSRVTFPNPWPSDAEIQHLVQNACGQFIYVSTVMKFVRAEYSHPITQLHIILDNPTHQISQKSPFAELDNLYHIIVSANPEQGKVLLILSTIILLPKFDDGLEPTPEFIELFLGLPTGDVDLSLRGMHSVLDIGGQGDNIRIYHTSFMEYLCDKSRSGEFCIDTLEQHNLLASQWLAVLGRLCTSPVERWGPSMDILLERWAEFCSSNKSPSKQLLQDLASLNPLNILMAACIHIPSQPKTKRLRTHWIHWSSFLHTFQTISFWLEHMDKSVHHENMEHFKDVQDYFHMHGSLDAANGTVH